MEPEILKTIDAMVRARHCGELTCRVNPRQESLFRAAFMRERYPKSNARLANGAVVPRSP